MKTFLFIFLFIFSGVGKANVCFVTGAAVDENTNPVANAIIIAHSPPTGWEDLILQHISDERGHFRLETSCDSNDTNLFVAPPLDYQNNYIPVSPPFSIENKEYKKLLPIKLPLLKKGEFDVGKVIVPKYYKIEINFLDGKGKSFLPEDLDSGLWLRIKTFSGELVKWGGLSINDFKNSTSPNKSSMLMTLPEGKWIVEVGFNENKKPYFYPDKIVDLSNIQNDEIKKITLKMSKKKVL